MRNKEFLFGLFHFAADGTGGAGSTSAGGNGTGSEGIGEDTGIEGTDSGGKSSGTVGMQQNKTFDEILEEGYQAEFDKRMQDALQAQKSKLETMYSEKTTEAEKLAKMNEEEKATYLQQKKDRELSDREAAVTRKELMAEAKNTLAEKKLPVSLAEILNYTDADSCKKSIAAVEKAFQKAVEEAVENRLKGGDPMRRAQGSRDTDLEKQIEAIMMGRR